MSFIYPRARCQIKVGTEWCKIRLESLSLKEVVSVILKQTDKGIYYKTYISQRGRSKKYLKGPNVELKLADWTETDRKNFNLVFVIHFFCI